MQLVVGRIGRPHGVRGEVTVEVRTDDPDVRFAPGTALATDPAEAGPLTVEGARWHKGILLLALAGVTDRDAAEELRGTLLVIDSADVPRSADPDEFRDHELIGLAVLTVAGERVGEVTDVLHHGQDLLVVRRPARSDAYVPFVKALVPEVDLDRGVLVVDAPPGLFDLGESE
ncbi:ribosome maturation factor RimM [Sphaerimonospora mesophila]|uniref:ribosome maturation factor RimM n=1 Tax=Sphaerimonospora mesophila TaxID=37483 RepID=UPI0006E45A92